MANFPIAAPVECTDGPCGKSIAVPIGQVDFVDGSTVYLKIDRASVGALPAAKTQRK